MIWGGLVIQYLINIRMYYNKKCTYPNRGSDEGGSVAGLEIQQLSALTDNYIYLVHCAETGETAVVDPGQAKPVLAALDQFGWKLTHILNTHHHADHTGGNLDLKQATGCKVIGARVDTARIPGITNPISEGEVIMIGRSMGRVINVKGHTRGHIAYWFEDSSALFCGDTLFSLGCGRLFEGTPDEMWHSLLKIRDLPDDTKVYCAHEYTNANADFALSVDPDNAELRTRADEILKLREAGKPTVPSFLGSEKKINPFLRADVPAFQAALDMAGADPVSVFAEVRHRKDVF